VAHHDIANDKGIFDMLKLVNLTISAKFGRITNFCIQFQLHVIQYLTTQWRWAMPAKFSDVELCQIDPPGSLNTIQHLLWICRIFMYNILIDL